MDQNLTLLGIAVLNAFTAFMAWNTHRMSKLVVAATDGMKDALVASTAREQHAAGKEEGRVEGEVKAADVAKGVLLGTEIKQAKE